MITAKEASDITAQAWRGNNELITMLDSVEERIKEASHDGNTSTEIQVYNDDLCDKILHCVNTAGYFAQKIPQATKYGKTFSLLISWNAPNIFELNRGEK